MGRVLGIDFGMKRTGIAVTDPLQISVNPLTTLETKEFDEFLSNYILKEPVECIVFGDPYHTDGTPTEVHKVIHQKGDILKKKHPSIKIDYIDETLSSKQAVQLLVMKGTPKNKRTKEAIDVMSAVIILQKYLNHI